MSEPIVAETSKALKLAEAFIRDWLDGDDRVENARGALQAIRAALGSSAAPHRYTLGERVHVLRACRLPVEEVLHTGVITGVEYRHTGTIYWIDNVLIARSVDVLRPAGV